MYTGIGSSRAVAGLWPHLKRYKNFSLISSDAFRVGREVRIIRPANINTIVYRVYYKINVSLNEMSVP